MTSIYTDIEFEIDASEIISAAHSEIYSIAEEAIGEYDISDKVEEEVVTAVENVIDDKIQEYLLENPAAILDAIGKAIGWAQGRQRLVLDQATELLKKQQEVVELKRQLEELDLLTAPKTEKTNETPADL